MHVLRDILYEVNIEAVNGPTSVGVSGLQTDSRKVGEGDVFIAIAGTAVDGHKFIPSTIEQGVAAVICEQMPETTSAAVTYVVVKDSRVALARMAANFYSHPSSKLKLVGVTGTNGKTTTVTMLFELFTRLGYKVGLLSTIENKIGKEVIPSTHTTPDPVVLNSLLNDMVESGCAYAFMEVSSHAIHQNRIEGLTFAGGIFTNISRDHLDYHKDLKEYIFVKKAFFDMLSPNAFALINTDDRRGRVMVQNTKAKVKTYALNSMADYKVRILESSFDGLILEVNNTELHTQMVGKFNAYNILAVYAAGDLLEQDPFELLSAISLLRGAEGRFEYVISEKDKVIAVIDYAHTPDALKNVLQTVSDVRTGAEHVITLVGCGGDRDKGKRPMMARIASEFSDKVILTSDNPRTETPESIIDEMKNGVPAHLTKKVLVIIDRKEAIRTACSMAAPKDILLVAGKGHEKYQEISGQRFAFDDKQQVLTALKEFER
ncbi:MAG: UDP-N-acetylmuramoyl-L-alanyl-D-glutamate--2,6-diaminopimelate ligase [Bacteroidetes bacterium]|nr:UDP-N-acetylmuramoyl-L-alanyl-D-glutamate--2,6-diaminopimelate ligase [Bacteroidota bacterium]